MHRLAGDVRSPARNGTNCLANQTNSRVPSESTGPQPQQLQLSGSANTWTVIPSGGCSLRTSAPLPGTALYFCWGALVEGAMIHDSQTGAVIILKKPVRSAKGLEEIREACPYTFPENSKPVASQRHMCYDRISHGLIPACVKACPSGHELGEQQEMQDLAKSRLAEVKKTFPGPCWLIRILST